MEGTIIVNAPKIEDEGISKTATLLNRGHNTYVQDLTLKNALDYYHSGAAGRAVCWQDKGDNTIFNRVRMLSYQDTYYSNNEYGHSYFVDSEIHGTVDFICGAGDVFFDHCLLVTERRKAEGGGRDIIAAPRTSKTQWGYVFSHCTIRNDASDFLYARGWQAQPRCIWLYTTLETPEHLQKSRFEPRGMRTIQSTFLEYGTMDAAGRNITPQSNVVTLTLNDERNMVETIMPEREVKRYALKNVFAQWRPEKKARTLEKQSTRMMRKCLKAL
jgi:pectin methylesterase-like acyl-CoA thioesterase